MGTADIEVSVMALGCWPFAGGVVWGEQDEGESIATVHAALDAGINFFDTAEGYEEGHSERVLGRGLAGQRQQAVIASKVSPNHLTPEGIAAACEQSLENLQTDYIDLYQIHWPNHDIPIETSWRALEDLLAAGKVRALGVANFASDDLADLVAVGRPAADQLPYSLLWRAIEFEVLARCRERDIGLICYAPLAQGLLTGRYAAADEVPGRAGADAVVCGQSAAGQTRRAWLRRGRVSRHRGDSRCQRTGRRAAGERGVGVGAQAGRGVTSLLVGARNPDELARNLPALALDLDAATMAELERLTEPVKEALGRNLDMWFAESRMR